MVEEFYRTSEVGVAVHTGFGNSAYVWSKSCLTFYTKHILSQAIGPK